jgi:probable Rubsico expression protein CbbX
MGADAAPRGFAMPRPGAAGPQPPEPAAPEPVPLAPDAKVDLGSQEQALRIAALLARLDGEFIGLAPVKDRVREIAALLLVDRLRQGFGLASSRPRLHMCFTGSPGTGKTTLATHMGELLKELGYLRTGQLVSVTRDDLVGQYVGHTAPKTKEVLKRAMGGVLLIDEAYYLYRPENERDYGQEAIEILLQVMEAQREDLVVILAGYADRMDVFFRSNPGMASRIAHHIDFPDFTLEELLRIGRSPAIADLVPSSAAVASSCAAATCSAATSGSAAIVSAAADRWKNRLTIRWLIPSWISPARRRLSLLPFDDPLGETLQRLLPLRQPAVQPGVLDRARDQGRSEGGISPTRGSGGRLPEPAGDTGVPGLLPQEARRRPVSSGPAATGGFQGRGVRGLAPGQTECPPRQARPFMASRGRRGVGYACRVPSLPLSLLP